MRTLIDTNVAIALANGVERIVDLVAQLPAAPLLSVVSRVELEGGVYANPASQQAHRALLDAVLKRVEEVAFGAEEVAAYGGIVRVRGFSRRLIIDRMIAAQAIAAGAVLATMNARDFRDVPELRLADWTA